MTEGLGQEDNLKKKEKKSWFRTIRAKQRACCLGEDVISRDDRDKCRLI